MVACYEQQATACLATATIAPCQCADVNLFVQDELSCMSQFNSNIGSSLYDVGADMSATMSSELVQICITVVTVPANPYLTRPTVVAPTHSIAKSAVTPTVTPAPIYASVSTTTSLSSTTTYTPIIPWSGSGNLLGNYCGDPAFSLFNGGPTALWVPVVGCVDEKPDCCPYGSTALANAGATNTALTTAITVTGTGQISVPSDIEQQVILGSCPGDYQTISGGCCPS